MSQKRKTHIIQAQDTGAPLSYLESGRERCFVVKEPQRGRQAAAALIITKIWTSCSVKKSTRKFFIHDVLFAWQILCNGMGCPENLKLTTHDISKKKFALKYLLFTDKPDANFSQKNSSSLV